ncbi:MAG: transketolase family protein [Lachnospiraceae bacterium]|nr:transketolase family protein [Lachnospiraceae bacterium]
MSDQLKATREGFGDEIVELGKANKNICVVDIDIGKSCKTQAFRKALPEQYYNVGIAEQNGASHQCVEDLGVLRTIPNMTVIMPADYYSARKLVAAAAAYDGPVYLRFTRDAIPVIYDDSTPFEIGKAHMIRDGKDVAIIANGDTVRLAITAAEELAKKGIDARVVDMHTVKPLDVDCVKDCIDKIGKIITVEDHNILNGLGSAVCEVVAEAGKGIVKRIGVQDQFGQSAPYERLLAMNGITVENIVATAEALQ